MLLALSVLLVLVTSFFCSLSEASLLSSSRARIHTLAQTSGSAKLVEQMKDNLDRPIAAILILNTVANTGGAAIAGREYQRTFDGQDIALFTVFLTVAVLIFAELLPKTLGVRFATPSIVWLARPLHALTLVMSPATYVVERMARLIGGRPKSSSSTLEDLQALVRLAVSKKAIEPAQQAILEAASELPRLKVDQIMIHRNDIVFLSLADDEETLLRKARQSMHSRLLLCRKDLDDIIGIVNIKEVLWRLVVDPEDSADDGLKRVLGEAVRAPLRVSDELDLPQLLQRFSREHEHLALATNRAGKVTGIVTLEDVIEELIGEVDDEYDRSPETVERLESGLWRLGGGTLWTDAARALGIRAVDMVPLDPDLDGRYDMHDLSADRLPGKLRTGGAFTIGPWRFKVTRMRRGKVLHLEALLMGQRSTPRSIGGKPLPV
jgi:CBS domain containing-hemolysin-like protein